MAFCKPVGLGISAKCLADHGNSDHRRSGLTVAEKPRRSFVAEGSFPIGVGAGTVMMTGSSPGGVAGNMRRRVTTAALSMLVGALWASAASAASISVLNSAPTDHIANLNLGGVTPAVQDASLFRVNAVSVARGLQLDLAHGRSWDPYGDVFPASASLNSAFLGGTNIFAGASFAIGRDVDLNVGH